MSFKEKRLGEVKDDLFLLGIGLGVENQSRIPKIFKDLKERLGIELNNEDQKKVRDVAVLKRDPKEFKAIFGEVFKKRKTKEFEVDKMNKEEAIKKVQELTKEVQGLKKKFGIKDEELSSVANIRRDRKERDKEIEIGLREIGHMVGKLQKGKSLVVGGPSDFELELSNGIGPGDNSPTVRIGIEYFGHFKFESKSATIEEGLHEVLNKMQPSSLKDFWRPSPEQGEEHDNCELSSFPVEAFQGLMQEIVGIAATMGPEGIEPKIGRYYGPTASIRIDTIVPGAELHIFDVQKKFLDVEGPSILYLKSKRGLSVIRAIRDVLIQAHRRLEKHGSKEEAQRLRKEFGIKDEELFLVAKVEKPIEQKVEERKKEAVEKKIAEKAEVIAQELFSVWGSGKYTYLGFYLSIKFILSPNSELNTVTIRARQKGKLFKRLVFHKKSGIIEVYKPGEWEKYLDPLYEIAVVRKREREKEEEQIRLEKRKKKLKKDFVL